IVTGASPNLRNLAQALEKAEVSPANYTVSSLAAAEAILSRQQKEAGTLVLDIGAGTTNLIVVEDGEIQHVAVIPAGGINLTNDLAIGLKTDLDVAEKVKLEHASLLPEHNKPTATVRLNKQSYSFEVSEITMIIEARVEELLELVDKELVKIRRSHKLPGGVVLCGGTASLPGIAEFTRDKLQLPARVGKIQNVGGLVDTVEGTAYCTVVGLMMLDMLLLPNSMLPQAKLTQSFPFAERFLKRFSKR
ncbi:MAG: cell division protein FtsA, partial [Candidatus Saccharimonadales bacterium]